MKKLTKEIFRFLKFLYNAFKKTKSKELKPKELEHREVKLGVSYFLEKDKILSQGHLSRWTYYGLDITFEGNENFLKATTSVTTDSSNGKTIVKFANDNFYKAFFKAHQKDKDYLAGYDGDTEISLPRRKAAPHEKTKMLMTRVVSTDNGCTKRLIVGSFVVDMDKDPTMRKTTEGVFDALMSMELTEGASEMYTLNTSLKDKEYEFRR